jgi:putative FmdB family regulatory protein
MPIYEYRCQNCNQADSFYLKSFDSPPPAGCRNCGDASLQRIMSAFAYHRSEADRMAQLDSKYYKMVDQAMANAPADSHPDHYLEQMVPFSQAKETGEPYFKE